MLHNKCIYQALNCLTQGKVSEEHEKMMKIISVAMVFSNMFWRHIPYIEALKGSDNSVYILGIHGRCQKQLGVIEVILHCQW